jgi:hypothetical protein
MVLSVMLAREAIIGQQSGWRDTRIKGGYIQIETLPRREPPRPCETKSNARRWRDGFQTAHGDFAFIFRNLSE